MKKLGVTNGNAELSGDIKIVFNGDTQHGSRDIKV